MVSHFSDRLLDAVDKRGNPICLGIDPVVESLPPSILERFGTSTGQSEASLDAIFEFTVRVLRIAAPLVPVVKFQSAFFEKYLWEGVEAYYSLVQEANSLGLLVIGDVKRGDIGSTAIAYAQAHLTAASGDDEFAAPDAITVNPMLGLDTLEPFVQTAKDHGKGLFVLVRTSNPGSSELQDAKLADGSTWSEMLAEKLNSIASQEGLIGTRGFSDIGAVVGGTQEHSIARLRQRLPKSIFLVPGYGAQGATAEMTREAFVDGRGAIISASRSILYAHSNSKYSSQYGENWEKCVEAAIGDMKAELGRVLGGG